MARVKIPNLNCLWFKKLMEFQEKKNSYGPMVDFQKLLATYSEETSMDVARWDI